MARSARPEWVRGRPKQRSWQCPLGATSGHIGKLFLVEANTTNLVTNLCVEGGLFERLVCARARPPVSGLLYRPLGGILHNRFTEGSTVIALNVSQLFAPIPIRSVDWRTSPPIYLAVISKRVWP